MTGTPRTLPDGSVVDSWSEAWRAFTEARELLCRPLAERREYLFGVGLPKARGEAGRAALEAELTRWFPFVQVVRA